MAIIDYSQVAQQNKRKQILPFFLLLATLLVIGFLVWTSYTKISAWSKTFNLSDAINNIQTSDQQQPPQTKESLATQHNSEGVKYLKAEDYLKAKAQFDLAIQSNPNDYRPYYNLGVVFANLNDWQSAIQSYQKTLALKPDYEPAQINLIGAYKSSGDCAKSKEAGDSFLSQKPQSNNAGKVHWMLADAALCLLDYQMAIDELNTVLSLQPDSADNYRIYNDMAVSYCALGKVEQGLDYGLKTINILETQTITGLTDVQQAVPYLTVANCYYRTGHDDTNATVYYKKALALNPDLVNQYRDLFLTLKIIKN